MKWIKINESTDYELVNDEESGSKLYEIGLWWGSGYTLDMYRAYAFSEEEALNYVVAYIEKTHPKWLESSDECAHEMMKEYDEESPEFQETFMYVDATSEGADEPHYIWSENLRIKELNSVRESIRDGFKKKRINKMNKNEQTKLAKEEVLVIDKIMHEAKITDYFKLRFTKTGRQYFWNGEDSERLNIRDGLQYICNTTLYGFDFALEFGLTQQEIDTWNAMIDRFGLSDEFKAENFKEREILHAKESTRKQTMKKLNITKEQFNRSRYFKNKYGTLKYVSESGKVYKTSKGRVLKFNESVDVPTTLYVLMIDKDFNRDVKEISIDDKSKWNNINIDGGCFWEIDPESEKPEFFDGFGWGNDEDGYKKIIKVSDADTRDTISMEEFKELVDAMKCS